MAKYSDELVDKIVELIEVELCSVAEICMAMNISRKTFYSWMKTKPEFSAEISRAQEHRDEVLLSLAHSSLKKRLSNYMLTEEKDTYIPDEANPSKLILKSKIICKKEYLPDLQTIKMVLARADKKKERAAARVDITLPEKDEEIMEPVTEEKMMEKDKTKGVVTLSESVPAEKKVIEKPVCDSKPKKVTSRDIKKSVRMLGNSHKGKLQGEYYRKVTA